jgi:threonine synthase
VLLAKYASLLPLTSKTPLVTLGEGNTPLVPSPKLARLCGLGEVYLKLEGLNPTGSFKDRGMVVAVAKAAEAGARAVLCASTGNTAASASAYAARFGLQAIVLVPQGAVAVGKLAQSLIHGAKVLALNGTFDRALEMARQLTEKHPVALVNSVNPHRLEGQATAAYEICDQLGRAPDYLFIPVGNAGNITAYWLGFCRYYDMGKVASRPKMMGWQAEGASPIVRGEPVRSPQTIATAIRIGNPASWRGALRARDESGGFIGAVTDDEIVEAYRFLAREEGIFCELASAASVAGLLRASRDGLLAKGKLVVCVLTGHGLKDPDTAMRLADQPTRVQARLDVVEEVLGWR